MLEVKSRHCLLLCPKPNRLVSWSVGFGVILNFTLNLFSDIEYSLVRSDSVVDTDLEGSEESVNKIDLETADPLETFDVDSPNNGASHSARMSNSRMNSCKLIFHLWILLF